MILVTFISIHFIIICDVLLWLTYETYPALSLKSGSDSFGDLDNNTFKGLTSLLSVEHKIQYDEHT
jgi:hypothetical protein